LEPDGSLDETFGNGGRLIIDLGGSEWAYHAVTDSQGRIVSEVIDGSSQQYSLLRHTATGQLDSSFGTNGRATIQQIPNRFHNVGLSIAIDAEDGILVPGSTVNPDPDLHVDFAVARYTVQGTLDATFGHQGIAAIDLGAFDDHAYGVATDGQNRVVVVGYTNQNSFDIGLARLFSAGGGNAPVIDITVNNVDPEIVSLDGAGADQTVNEGDLVTLDGAFADVGLDDSHSQQWTVVASNGQVVDQLNIADGGDSDGSGGSSFSFVPVDNGDYTVTYTVTDDDGGVHSEVATVNVNNVASQNVNAGTDQTVDEGDTVNLSASFSDPGSADTHSQTWSVVSSNGQTIASGSGASFSFVPNDNGTYSVTYTVTDDDNGSTADTVLVTVNNVAPAVAAENASVTVSEGATVGNMGLWSDPGADDVTLMASVGTVTQNANGTWNWSHPTTDGPDNNQTVTITATDSDGIATSTSFNLVVNNVAPTVAAENASVTVSEGATAGNTGTFADLGADVVTLSASVGNIVDNGNGTWSWSHPTTDGPDQSQTVTITATDSDGLATSTGFNLVVNNVAPQNVDAGADQTVDEGDTVSLSGSFTDPGSSDTHTQTWSVLSSNGQTIVNGSGASFSFVPDDNGTYTVTFTVTDDDSGSTADTVEVTVNNVAPTANAGGPYLTFEDVPITLNGTGTDVAGEADSLRFAWDLDNDDSFETDGESVAFNPAALGLTGTHPHTVKLRVTDKDDAPTITSATVQIVGQGITQVGSVVYVVSGPTTNDVVTISHSGNNIRVVASFNKNKLVEFAGASVTDIHVRTRGGNDVVNAASIARPMTIDGGSGNDVLNGGTIRNTIIGDAGNDVLNGGAGDDILVGGAGNDALNGSGGNDALSGGDGNDSLTGSSGRDLLIGGRDNDSLNSGADEDILVGGLTLHDNSIAALDAIMVVWKSTQGYDSRVASLTAAAGYLRAGTSVLDDDDPDSINGGAGRDLIFGDTSKLDGVMDSIALEAALDTLFAVV
jgi:uncharacterized delta-60 repeat protein